MVVVKSFSTHATPRQFFMQMQIIALENQNRKSLAVCRLRWLHCHNKMLLICDAYDKIDFVFRWFGRTPNSAKRKICAENDLCDGMLFRIRSKAPKSVFFRIDTRFISLHQDVDRRFCRWLQTLACICFRRTEMPPATNDTIKFNIHYVQLMTNKCEKEKKNGKHIPK